MDKEQKTKLMYALDALDDYLVKAAKTGAVDFNALTELSGNLVFFMAQLDPYQEIPEPEKQYTLAEASGLLA